MGGTHAGDWTGRPRQGSEPVQKEKDCCPKATGEESEDDGSKEPFQKKNQETNETDEEDHQEIGLV